MIPGRKSEGAGEERKVAVEAGGVTLESTLALPGEAKSPA